MGEHGTPGERRKLKLTESLEVGARDALSLGGGTVTAVLGYASAKVGLNALGLISEAREAGLISEFSGSSAVETIVTGGLGFAAYKAAAWTVRMHQMARAIETGKRHSKKGHS